MAIRFFNLLFPFVLYIVGALVFFRFQILSNFDLIFGDIGDTRLVVFLHEHVFRWLCGDGSVFLSPPFFFNQTDTLGYADAFLLDQVFYAPSRLLGADPLLATSLVAIILSPIAYVFLYMFLRRLDISVPMASIAALIVTFANNLYLKSNHPQTFTVYYIPIVAYLGLRAVSELHRKPVQSCIFAFLAAGLYGLLFSTGYYMSWFFGLALLIAVPMGSWMAWPATQAWWTQGPARVIGLGVTSSLSFLAALSIFGVIYAPVLALGLQRRFDDYLTLAPTPIDIVNVGRGNLVWGGLIRSLHLFQDVALTPAFQCMAWASALIALQRHFWPSDNFGRIRRALVIASASICVLFYILTIKVGNFSLYRVPYAIVPGANAIRDGYRGMVVANLFAAIAIGLTCDRLIQVILRQPRALARRAGAAGLVALLSLAVIEQVNLERLARLSRKSEHDHLAALGSAPRECLSFYIAPEANYPQYAVQIDAMMIALTYHRPTINGYSGFSPPGWDFFDTNDPNYEQRAVLWATKHGVAGGLCRVDVEHGTWTMADTILARISESFRPPPDWIDMSLMFHQTGNVRGGVAIAGAPADPPGYMLYGPYMRLSPGSYNVYFGFICIGNQAGHVMEVTSGAGKQVLAQTRLEPRDPRCDGTPHEIELPFRLTSLAEMVEFRTWFGGTGSLEVSSLRVRSQHD